MIFIKANTIYEVSLEDASIYKIEILKSDISIYIQLYNAKRVKIIFLNYYGIIDYHAICQEIGDFEIQHDSDFIQQIISEEIESIYGWINIHAFSSFWNVEKEKNTGNCMWKNRGRIFVIIALYAYLRLYKEKYMNGRRYMIFGFLQAIMDSAVIQLVRDWIFQLLSKIQQEYNDYNLITD